MLPRRVIAIVSAFMLVFTLFPVSFTITATAATNDDPMSVVAAPHFSQVIYTIDSTAPAYQTSCDERGDFKVAVGLPSLTVNDSKVIFESASSYVSRMALSDDDVPAISASNRTNIQMSFKVASVSKQVNISLYQLSTGDYLNISLNSSKFNYFYSKSVGKTFGILYSPAVADTYYTLAIDLSTTTCTIYLYSAAGTLIANRLISNSALKSGEPNEIRFETSSGTNTITVDYLYILNEAGTYTHVANFGIGVVDPDGEYKSTRVDLDRTADTFVHDREAIADIFGFTDPDLHSKTSLTMREALNAGGLEQERAQKVNGRAVAQGWRNFRATIESNLKTYIAEAESCDVSDVHLVDYSSDYTHFLMSFDKNMIGDTTGAFDNGLTAVSQAHGTSAVHTTHISSFARSETVTAPLDNTAITLTGNDTEDDSIVDQYITIPRGGLLGGIMDAFLGPQTIPNPMYSVNQMREWAKEDWKDAQDWMNSQLSTVTNSYNNWMNTTTTTFNNLSAQLFGYIAVAQASMDNLIKDYQSTVDQLSRGFNKYYDATQEQFQATNAIIAKLLLQNADWANISASTNAFFAGQMTQANQVLMNITQALTGALDPNSFWQNVNSGGKASTEPLSFITMLGNNVQQYLQYIIVFVIVLIICIVVYLVIRRRSSSNRVGKQ